MCDEPLYLWFLDGYICRTYEIHRILLTLNGLEPPRSIFFVQTHFPFNKFMIFGTDYNNTTFYSI